jgi:hypothetical protein
MRISARNSRLITLLLIAASATFSADRGDAQDCAALLNQLLHSPPGAMSPGQAQVLANTYNQNCNGSTRPVNIPERFSPQENQYWQPQAPQSDQTENAQMRAALEKATADLYNQLHEFENAYHSLRDNESLSSALTHDVKSVNPPVTYVDPYKLPPQSTLPSQNSPGVKLNPDTINKQFQLGPDNCKQVGAC